MGVISIVGKIVLVLTNMLLLLLSLAMIILGIVVVAGKDIYNSILENWEDKLKGANTELGVTVDTSNFTLSDFVLPLAYGLIVVGIVIGSVSLIGCIGGCYTLKILLIIYSVVLGILFLIQLIIVIVIYANKSAFDSTVKPFIKDTLDDYAGIEGTDAKSLSWNALMNFKDCCGVDGYNDFKNLDNWPATINGVTYALQTPVICCVSKTSDYTCATAPTDSTNYWKTGCYDKLYDFVVDNSLVIIVIAFLLVAQFILLFFTIWILCTMNNKIDII